MDNEIVLSDELWDYYITIEEIRDMVQNAYVLAVAGSTMIYDGSTYRGNAYDELYFLVTSAAGHLQKLMMLYSAAEVYLINTIQEKCEEEELLGWIFNHLGE